MNEIQFIHLEAVLEDYGRRITEEYKAELDAAGKVATSKLRDTVRYYVAHREDSYVLRLALQDYWKWIEYGTRTAVGHNRGKFPPLKPFIEWVQAKHIPLEGKTIERKAAQVAAGVYWHGTRPFYFLTKAMPDEGEVMDRIKKAIAEDLADWVRLTIASRI